MTAAHASDGHTVVLRNVSWDLYAQLRDDPHRHRVRMTYLDGELALMSPSGPHERINRLLEQFVSQWCDVHEIARACFGSTTYRREAHQAGLEPDTCFYIANEAVIRGREELDLQLDPPPDLAIEVDIASRSDARMSVYARLGVPGVWRTNGEQMQFLVLGSRGTYREVEDSRCLPGLQPQVLVSLLNRRQLLDDTTLLREFRDWARGIS